MLGSEEGSSIRLPSPPQFSPQHEFQSSGPSRAYIWILASSPFANVRNTSDNGETLFPPLEVSCTTLFPENVF